MQTSRSRTRRSRCSRSSRTRRCRPNCWRRRRRAASAPAAVSSGSVASRSTSRRLRPGGEHRRPALRLRTGGGSFRCCAGHAPGSAPPPSLGCFRGTDGRRRCWRRAHILRPTLAPTADEPDTGPLRSDHQGQSRRVHRPPAAAPRREPRRDCRRSRTLHGSRRRNRRIWQGYDSGCSCCIPYPAAWLCV